MLINGKVLKFKEVLLDQDAKACNEAKNDEVKYNKTFALTNSIAGRCAVSSAKATAGALE